MSTALDYTPDQIVSASHRLLIGGNDIEAASGDRFTRISPAHGIEVGSYSNSSAVDVDAAVHAARTALESGWRTASGAVRSKLLYRVAALVRRDAETLSLAETLDTGKPISQSRNEVESTAELWEYAATLARHSQGDAHNGLGADTLAMVIHEPVGVVGMITPWNFPILIISQKLPFALAAGNTAIVKPSESSPTTTVLLGGLIREAGFPDGVVNVLTGSGGLGSAIVNHPGIDMISFTGSTEVGKKIAGTAGADLKKIELELGGKNPQIITRSADMAAAVDAGVFGGYFNTGQCCNAGSRLIVHRSIVDDFTQAVAARTRLVPVGDPLLSSTQVGSLVNAQQLAVVERYVGEGIASGATLVMGGASFGPDSLFFEPTLFSNVTPDMSIASEEIFGPVLSILAYDTLDEAVRLANSTSYGLSAGIWTADIDEALSAARDLRAGTIWVNRWMDGYPELPFGGYGASGIGRELGRQALAEFSETKTIQLQVGPRITRWVDAPDGGKI